MRCHHHRCHHHRLSTALISERRGRCTFNNQLFGCSHEEKLEKHKELTLNFPLWHQYTNRLILSSLSNEVPSEKPGLMLPQPKRPGRFKTKQYSWKLRPRLRWLKFPLGTGAKPLLLDRRLQTPLKSQQGAPGTDTSPNSSSLHSIPLPSRLAAFPYPALGELHPTTALPATTRTLLWKTTKLTTWVLTKH